MLLLHTLADKNIALKYFKHGFVLLFYLILQDFAYREETSDIYNHYYH